MIYGGGNPNRRYSLLPVSSGVHHRPRSSSTSVVTVTESSPDPRSVGREKRPSATPCTTPCFVSPRMAFSTQFSYDSPIQVSRDGSPIQIVTCSSGRVLKPVSRWTSRFSPSLRKVLLVTLLATLGLLGYLMVGDRSHGSLRNRSGPPSVWKHSHRHPPPPFPPGAALPQCDAQRLGGACDDSSPVTSSLQKFLNGGKANDPSADTPRTDHKDTGPNEPSSGQENRNYRPRIPTVHGQYEGDTNQEDPSSGSPLKRDSTQREGGGTRNHKTLNSQDLQAVREGLARAKRSYVSKESEAPQSHQEDVQPQSTRVGEEEALPSQDYAGRHPRPRHEALGHSGSSSPQEVTKQPQQEYEHHTHPKVSLDATRQPQEQYEHHTHPKVSLDATRQHQEQYQHHTHPKVSLDATRQPQEQYEHHTHPKVSLDATRQHQEQYEHHTHPKVSLDATRQHQPQYEHHVHSKPNLDADAQPQHGYDAYGQPQGHYDPAAPPHSPEDSIRESHNPPTDLSQQGRSEEANQPHFGEPQSHHGLAQRPRPQEDTNGQTQSSPQDLEAQTNPKEDGQSHQMTLDQLYMQQINLEHNNYLREQHIIQKEIQHREILRRHEQEGHWWDQRSHTHEVPQEYQRTLENQQRALEHNGLEQWESWYHHHEEPRREEFIPYDEHHSAWRDQRFPRGVNQRRYYIHSDL